MISACPLHALNCQCCIKVNTIKVAPVCFSSLSVFFKDIHRVYLSSCEPVSAAAHLYSRPDSPLHQQEDRRNASTHLRHRRQLLLQHATQQQRPVLHHQVSSVQCECCVGRHMSAYLLFRIWTGYLKVTGSNSRRRFLFFSAATTLSQCGYCSKIK